MNVDELFFITIFHVTNDHILWDLLWNELTRIYGCEKPFRPTKLSIKLNVPEIKTLFSLRQRQVYSVISEL